MTDTKGYNEYSKETSFTIASQSDANGNPLPLLIYGLNLTNAQTNQGTNALLQLSGSNITLDHATLTGPSTGSGQATGSGTAIQVNGTGVTIGPSVTIDNFEKGIYIKSGASAKITRDSIKVKDALITNAIVFESPLVNSAFDEKLIGKHLSEADPNYADKFVGKLAEKTAEACIGSVEALFKDGKVQASSGAGSSCGANISIFV